MSILCEFASDFCSYQKTYRSTMNRTRGESLMLTQTRRRNSLRSTCVGKVTLAARSLTKERSSSEHLAVSWPKLLLFSILLILVSDINSAQIWHQLHCSMLGACFSARVCLSSPISTHWHYITRLLQLFIK